MAFKVTGYEETLSANGSSSEAAVVGPTHVHVSGTWGGGTVVVQRKDADGTWHDIVTASYTADVDKLINFPINAQNILRCTLSGATSPSLKTIIQGSSLLLTG